jgi:multiple RNA-binding domain-containing protein 1
MAAAAGAEADALSTRLIVKNLPKHADDKRLREHFAKQGRVTDAKVARTKDGKSRLFGFVGYESHAEAAQALKFFDRSFLDTAKLSVELAHRKGDASIARPWSRHSAGSSLNAKATGKRSAVTAAAAAEADEQYEVVDVKAGAAKRARTAAGDDSATDGDSQVKSLEKREFMEAMKPRSDTKFWANDDALAGGEVAAATAAPVKQKSLKRQRAASDADSSSSDGDSSAADSDAEASDDNDDNHDDVPDKTAAVSDAAVSHLDWLKSKTNTSAALAETTAKAAAAAADSSSSDSSSDDDDSDADETVKPVTAKGETAATAKKQADSSAALCKTAAAVKNSTSSSSTTAAVADATKQRSSRVDSATSLTDNNSSNSTANNDNSATDTEAASGRLFIRNLAYSCSEADLTSVFEQYGTLSSVHVAVDDVQQQCKGFAFVQFAAADAAAAAMTALDGTSFQGRLLHIIPARRAPGKL